MNESVEEEVTRILRGLTGRPDGPGTATNRLFAAAYPELCRLAAALMRKERRDHVLQPSLLVDEAYLRLAGHTPKEWRSRAHFFGIVASAMRRVLVEDARHRGSEKRGGGWRKVTLDDEPNLAGRSEFGILEMDRILTQLAVVSPRAARVVELRVFGGFTEHEVAEILGVCERTIRRDWHTAAKWLTRELWDRVQP